MHTGDLQGVTTHRLGATGHEESSSQPSKVETRFSDEENGTRDESVYSQVCNELPTEGQSQDV